MKIRFCFSIILDFLFILSIKPFSPLFILSFFTFYTGPMDDSSLFIIWSTFPTCRPSEEEQRTSEAFLVPEQLETFCPSCLLRTLSIKQEWSSFYRSGEHSIGFYLYIYVFIQCFLLFNICVNCSIRRKKVM